MGASLEVIARKVGRTRAWLSLIELGNLRVSAENLQRIENAIVEYEHAFSAVQQILAKTPTPARKLSTNRPASGGISNEAV